MYLNNLLINYSYFEISSQVAPMHQQQLARNLSTFINCQSVQQLFEVWFRSSPEENIFEVFSKVEEISIKISYQNLKYLEEVFFLSLSVNKCVIQANGCKRLTSCLLPLMLKMTLACLRVRAQDAHIFLLGLVMQIIRSQLRSKFV
jgi:hypothetical protein